MIRDLLIRAADSSKIAIIEENRDITYRALYQRSAAFQNQIPHEPKNIALLLPNCADYIAALFGIFQAGAVAFPLNVKLTPHEITPLLAKAKVHTIITSLEFSHLLSGICSPPKIIYTEELPSLSGELPPNRDISPDSPMILLTTSGTTGNVKLVTLTERNVKTTVNGFILHNCYEIFDKINIKYIFGTPFPSVYGLLLLSTCLTKLFPIVIPKEAVSLDILYKAAQEQGVTHYEGGAAIPTLMDQMSDRPVPYDISSLKFIGYGGSKLDSEVLMRLARSFPGIHVCTGYGSTESASLITRPFLKLPPDKLDTVGIPIPEVTVMIDAEGEITDTPRITGEVVVKGPNIMAGYYENDEETRKIIRNGYLYTGDIGFLDEEGYLYLCGRKKNVIKVRGFSVYAEEVEACLMNSGLLRDCIVYGRKDSLNNEAVCAEIVMKKNNTGLDEVYGYCRKHLADYKCPKEINIVGEIKKTVTGKASRSR